MLGMQVADGEHEGLLGLFTVSGHYTLDNEKPYRQCIHFKKLRLEPQDPRHLDKWLAFAKDSNSSMVTALALICQNPAQITLASLSLL